ncbi:hypothetical protein BDN70DRAFT_435834 [Pholiota conissans]|uniref:Uncharacterized protein n=1 Tax=Pholiota conissans TaxID=109636 RepID=A0A9P5Z672_9AGAR|nr:hypothetical protein BDN70DRAFT_435834 [Pholiota conissans]
MPVASTSKRVNRRNASSAAQATLSAKKSSMLRIINEPETLAWSEALKNESVLNTSFESLDEACDYPFKNRDPVWVRTKGDKWTFGKVSGVIRTGPTRYQQGFFYHVNFGPKHNVRKYFAPMNGEIKPDTQKVRRLLRDEGWIGSDTDSVTDDTQSDYTE